MLLRRFGRTVDSVEPDFRATAFNEIDFRRRPGFSMEWEEFEAGYERVGEVALASESEGHVKLEAETELLEVLRRRLSDAIGALGPGEALLIESRPGHDYPRTHEHTDAVVIDGHNRLYFKYAIDPPLKLGVYRRKA